MSFLDSLLGALAYGADVTQLDAIVYGTETPAILAQPRRRGVDVALSCTYLGMDLGCIKNSAVLHCMHVPCPLALSRQPIPLFVRP
jgi:hypothetical protein